MKNLFSIFLFCGCCINFATADSFNRLQLVEQKLTGFSPGLLKNISLRDICEDSKGFVWISSLYGLMQYDGYEFKYFRHTINNPKQQKQIIIAELIYKKESFEITGICMEIHRILGHGFSEVVYKDAMEYEILTRQILFAREKEYAIKYKDIILKHNYFADYVVFDKIILEVKAAEGGIDEAAISQTLNYLKASVNKLGLSINFARQSLEYQRIVY